MNAPTDSLPPKTWTCRLGHVDFDLSLNRGCGSLPAHPGLAGGTVIDFDSVVISDQDATKLRGQEPRRVRYETYIHAAWNATDAAINAVSR
jgi:hypothetical protein